MENDGFQGYAVFKNAMRLKRLSPLPHHRISKQTVA